MDRSMDIHGYLWTSMDWISFFGLALQICLIKSLLSGQTTFYSECTNRQCVGDVSSVTAPCQMWFSVHSVGKIVPTCHAQNERKMEKCACCSPSPNLVGKLPYCCCHESPVFLPDGLPDLALPFAFDLPADFPCFDLPAALPDFANHLWICKL